MHGVAAALTSSTAIVEIDLAACDALREVNRIAGLEEDVQPPALDLRRLVLVPDRCLGRLGHARGIRCPGDVPFREMLASPERDLTLADEREASNRRASSTIRSSRRCEAASAACWSWSAMSPSARRRNVSAVRSSSSRRRSAASSRIARMRFSNSSAPASLSRFDLARGLALELGDLPPLELGERAARCGRVRRSRRGRPARRRRARAGAGAR